MPSTLEVIFQGVCVFFPHAKQTIAVLVRASGHMPVLAACAEHRLDAIREDLWVDLDGEEIRLFDGEQRKKIKKATPVLDFEGYPCFKRIPGFPTKLKKNVDIETGDVNDVCAARVALNGGAITTQTDADHVWELKPIGGPSPINPIKFDFVRAEVVYRTQLENDTLRIDLAKKEGDYETVQTHLLRAINGKVRFWLSNDDASMRKRASRRAANDTRDFHFVYNLFDVPAAASGSKYNLVKVGDKPRRRAEPSFCTPKSGKGAEAKDVSLMTLPVPCVGGCTC